MRKSGLFWALVLIGVGVVLLLDNLGVFAFLNVSVWGLIGPLLLIALGVYVLWGANTHRAPLATTTQSIPLGSAARARLHIHHGAGRLDVRAGAAAGELLSGSFRGGLDARTELKGDLFAVELHQPSCVAPWAIGPWEWSERGGLDWSVAVNDQVPLEISIESGAGEARLDLAGLRVSDLRMQTGASKTEITLPAAAGFTRARLEAGAASVDVRVPAGVAARIRMQGALAGTTVETARFPRRGEYYESPDYAAAANKVELDIEAALGAVDVR